MLEVKNYDEMYKSYVQYCKDHSLIPSSMHKMFGKEISMQKQEQRVDIAALSKAKKQKAPILSETAKEALVVPVALKILTVDKGVLKND
jgi:hypothetical protein